jgi:hypothetical protein
VDAAHEILVDEGLEAKAGSGALAAPAAKGGLRSFTGTGPAGEVAPKD